MYFYKTKLKILTWRILCSQHPHFKNEGKDLRNKKLFYRIICHSDDYAIGK